MLCTPSHVESCHFVVLFVVHYYRSRSAPTVLLARVCIPSRGLFCHKAPEDHVVLGRCHCFAPLSATLRSILPFFYYLRPFVNMIHQPLEVCLLPLHAVCLRLYCNISRNKTRRPPSRSSSWDEGSMISFQSREVPLMRWVVVTQGMELPQCLLSRRVDDVFLCCALALQCSPCHA